MSGNTTLDIIGVNACFYFISIRRCCLKIIIYYFQYVPVNIIKIYGFATFLAPLRAGVSPQFPFDGSLTLKRGMPRKRGVLRGETCDRGVGGWVVSAVRNETEKTFWNQMPNGGQGDIMKQPYSLTTIWAKDK